MKCVSQKYKIHVLSRNLAHFDNQCDDWVVTSAGFLKALARVSCLKCQSHAESERIDRKVGCRSLIKSLTYCAGKRLPRRPVSSSSTSSTPSLRSAATTRRASRIASSISCSQSWTEWRASKVCSALAWQGCDRLAGNRFKTVSCADYRSLTWLRNFSNVCMGPSFL